MKPLVISNFQNGKSDSPYTGFYEMRNIDINKQTGSIQLSYLPVGPSDLSIFNNTPVAIDYSPSDNRYYALTASGRVLYTANGGAIWTELSGNTISNSNGNGLRVWKGHVFVARDTNIDVYKISSGQWFNGWMTLTNSYEHPIFHSVEDDILYIGDGWILASVEENAGKIFSASDATTYTQTANVLDLSPIYIITKINAIGLYLMVGTRRVGVKEAFIFPYDLANNPTSFESPIRIPEFGVTAMASDGNTLYVATGTEGNIYITNVSGFKKVATIPGEFNDVFDGTINIYDMFFKKGYLMVAVGIGNTLIRGAGVYCWNGKAWCVDNTPSTLSDGSSSIVNIKCLYPISTDSYFIGYQDGTTYSIETVGGGSSFSVGYGNRYTNYSGYFETELFNIGAETLERKFQTINIKLGKSLSTGQGVRVKYRKNLTDSFTTLGTYDFATYGAKDDIRESAALPSLSKIEVRCELTSSDTTSPELTALVFE